VSHRPISWKALLTMAAFAALVDVVRADIAPLPTPAPRPTATPVPAPPAPTPVPQPAEVTEAANALSQARANLFQAEIEFWIVYFTRSWDPWEVSSYYWSYISAYQQYRIAYWRWQQAINKNGLTPALAPLSTNSPARTGTGGATSGTSTQAGSGTNTTSGRTVSDPKRTGALDNPFNR
jgi:hypothetical protein